MSGDDFAVGEPDVGEKAFVTLDQRAADEAGFEAHGQAYNETSAGFPTKRGERFLAESILSGVEGLGMTG